MEIQDLVCICGKEFGQENALSKHNKTCPSSKRKISELLKKSRDIWAVKVTEREERVKKKARYFNPVLEQPSSLQFNISTNLEVSHSNIGDQPAPPDAAPDAAPPDAAPDAAPPDAAPDAAPPDAAPDAAPPDAADAAPDDDLDQPLAIRRTRRINVPMPKRFDDMVPTPLSPVLSEHMSSNLEQSATVTTLIQSAFDPAVCATSRKNDFRLYRKYLTTQVPSHDPEDFIGLDDLTDSTDGSSLVVAVEVSIQSGNQLANHHESSDYEPYPNISSFLIGEWYWNGSIQKSKADFHNLLSVLKSPDFDVNDIRKTEWNTIDHLLGGPAVDSSDRCKSRTGRTKSAVVFNDAGWIKEEIFIGVPFNRSMNNCKPQKFMVGEMYRRSIVSVLRERLASFDSRYFHLEPYELFWQPLAQEKPVRVYGELYSSPAFIQEHKRLQQSSLESGCQLPRVIAALMFSSDETHLTQFGETKLWPVYMFFGNDSKYRRARPGSHLCNHVAYFIRLPETFKDFVRSNSRHSKGPTPPLASYCLREAIHSQWKALLDDEFVNAYEHGVVIKCSFDGLERRFFPRIFTLSADYKEKIILANIRNLGNCPCPRCFVLLKRVHNMGLRYDRWTRKNNERVDDEDYRKKVHDARDFILKKRLAVNNKKVETILKDTSLVPSENAFSNRLSKFGFNIFGALAVNLMHDIESGNWRSLFIHILRILNCLGGKNILEMDWRYRQTPSFKYDTIRRFRKNCSEMRNMAARDWEDMLQCAIPVFEGLLPSDHNDRLLDLLFCFADWHGMAKLRMHTDVTLKTLNELTSDIGDKIRDFKRSTCTQFQTRELLRESTARTKRARKLARKEAASGHKDDARNTGQPEADIPGVLPNTPENAGPSLNKGEDTGLPLSSPADGTQGEKASNDASGTVTAQTADNTFFLPDEAAGSNIPLRNAKTQYKSKFGQRENVDARPDVPASRTRSATKKQAASGCNNGLSNTTQSGDNTSVLPACATEGLNPSEGAAAGRGAKRQSTSNLRQRNSVDSRPNTPSSRTRRATKKQAASGCNLGPPNNVDQPGSSTNVLSGSAGSDESPDVPAARARRGRQKKSISTRNNDRSDTGQAENNSAALLNTPEEAGTRLDTAEDKRIPLDIPEDTDPSPDTPEDKDLPPDPEEADTDLAVTSGRRLKTFNLSTYKFHAMGDYVAAIRKFGTTDSYSTEPGELAHRVSKNRFRRTSRKDIVRQLTQIERRQARIRRIREKITVPCPRTSSPRKSPSVEGRYHLGATQNNPVNLFEFLTSNKWDPAIERFISCLKEHLFPRASRSFGVNITGDSDSHPFLFIHRDRIYRHRTIHFNYTTYDVRRARDTVNPNTSHRDIMMLSDATNSAQSGEGGHPYVYARVLGIFHVNLICAIGEDAKPRRFDFLWVRWFQHAPPSSEYRLDELRFPPVGGDGALGFVDPSDVLRACHIIPAFKYGKVEPDLEKSALAKKDEDWKLYYVNRFADRDMLMRFRRGMAVGHAFLEDPISILECGAQESPAAPERMEFPRSMQPEDAIEGSVHDDIESVGYDSLGVPFDRENEDLASVDSRVGTNSDLEDNLDDEEFADVYYVLDDN